MPRTWTGKDLSELTRSYQGACVILAAAELDIFGLLANKPLSAAEVAKALNADPRGTTILLDALSALELLDKSGDLYRPAAGTSDVLTEGGAHSMLAMAQHQANCLRSWAQLARVVKTGKPYRRDASVRGDAADYAAFIEAMDNISRITAPELVAAMPALQFTHLLDVGGGSGTWTIAFLNRYPNAQATLFDLPKVLPQATTRLAEAGMTRRVRLVGGDFMADPLPKGADLALVSAIIHQMSREDNRKLFASVFVALHPGGQILLRDHVMDNTRTSPPAGALFAINMLVNTDTGTTFTFDEIREDLAHVGFGEAKILRRDDTMNCLLIAPKPA
jgi:SAM-dependent methyltransferase